VDLSTEGPNVKVGSRVVNEFMDNKKRKTEESAYGVRGRGEAQATTHVGQELSVAPHETDTKEEGIIHKVLEPKNLRLALKRVKANKGAPGVDTMTTEELTPYLKGNWAHVKERIASGTYRPAPVKRVDIPKPGGGIRSLGVPTVLDRFIQQAILQVLTPIFEPTFSDQSFGFRPARSAHQAVERARSYIEEGFEYVVDIDIEKFFDKVNHDRLMAKVATTINDKALLGLIRRYLQAGILTSGVVIERHEGTPQGGPLSPLLADIYLTELDKELEKRGHRFVRYADDCNIYLKSERAAKRVLTSVGRFLKNKLKLKVNEGKSTATKARGAEFLGFSFYGYQPVKVGISRVSLLRAKARIKKLTRRSEGISLAQMIRRLNQYLTGWGAYFSLASHPNLFKVLDTWIRRRLRCFVWKQWKRPKTRLKELRKRGLTGSVAFAAFSRKGPWRMAGSAALQRAIPNSFFEADGLVSLHGRYLSLHASRTAGCI